jgi:hypothetical protein
MKLSCAVSETGLNQYSIFNVVFDRNFIKHSYSYVINGLGVLVLHRGSGPWTLRSLKLAFSSITWFLIKYRGLAHILQKEDAFSHSMFTHLSLDCFNYCAFWPQ